MKKQLEYFEKDGERFDRITSVLRYFKDDRYMDWVISKGKREAKRVMTVAMGIGTNVDNAIRANVNRQPLPELESDEASSCYMGYQRWLDEYNPVLSTGERLYDERLFLTGEPDLFWNETVIDVKCSTVIRPEYWLQTEFYGRNRQGITHKAILRLDKGIRDYEYRRVPLNDDHWEAVVGAVKLYRYYKSVNDGGR